MVSFYSRCKLFVGIGSRYMLILTLKLVADIFMRLIMIENPQPRPSAIATSENTDGPVDVASRKIPSDREPSAVDDCHEQTNLLLPKLREVNEKKGIYFYFYLFRQRRFVTAQHSYMLCSILLSSIEATLPLHVQDAFGWGSFGAGMMFLGIQAPGLLLGPIVGWLRDRVGTRHPTWIAFAVLAPDIWLLGTPGDTRFPWASGQRGQAIYIASVVFIGVFSNLLNGVGMMESKCKHIHSFISSLLFRGPRFIILVGGSQPTKTMQIL